VRDVNSQAASRLCFARPQRQQKKHIISQDRLFASRRACSKLQTKAFGGYLWYIPGEWHPHDAWRVTAERQRQAKNGALLGGGSRPCGREHTWADRFGGGRIGTSCLSRKAACSHAPSDGSWPLALSSVRRSAATESRNPADTAYVHMHRSWLHGTMEGDRQGALVIAETLTSGDGGDDDVGLSQTPRPVPDKGSFWGCKLDPVEVVVVTRWRRRCDCHDATALPPGGHAGRSFKRRRPVGPGLS
jgi:hypothetical protein